MSFISDLLTGGADKIIGSVGNVIDSLTTTREEKLQLANELAKAEMQYELERQKMSIEEQAAILGDVQNARSREVSINTSDQATKFNKNLMPILTMVTVFFIFSILIMYAVTDKKNSEVLTIVSLLIGFVYGYYYGSSASSAAKDKTISNLKS